jgi:hypothetical protein
MDQSAGPRLEIDRASDWPAVLSFVRDYWHAIRASRPLPARADISPTQLKLQLPHILLADVVDEGADFRYRVVGTQLRPYFGTEPSTKLMSEALAPFGNETRAATIQAYRSVVKRCAPMRLTGSGAWYNRSSMLFDAYLAPLSDDGCSVNMVLGTFVFDWDRDHAFQPMLEMQK